MSTGRPLGRTARCERGRVASRVAGLFAAWGLASMLAGSAMAGPAQQALELRLEEPAPGVHVHYGLQEEPSAANAGDISNAGFVVGTRCVAVIDTGGTQAVGAALRRAIRKATSLPVCYVINTHGHPDHIFGNVAFVDDHPEFVGHARLAASMARHAPNYLAALRRDLGAAADGTAIVYPTRGVAATERLDLGQRALLVRAWPTAHTDADVTVFDETSGTLWLGDLLFVGHLPVVDGSLRGFLRAIDELKGLASRRVVPGHGRSDDARAAFEREERYLKRLESDVRASIASGQTLTQAIATVPCDDAGRWLLVDSFHARNVSAAFAELEWAD